jgi:hypothetical protein
MNSLAKDKVSKTFTEGLDSLALILQVACKNCGKFTCITSASSARHIQQIRWMGRVPTGNNLRKARVSKTALPPQLDKGVSTTASAAPPSRQILSRRARGNTRGQRRKQFPTPIFEKAR